MKSSIHFKTLASSALLLSFCLWGFIARAEDAPPVGPPVDDDIKAAAEQTSGPVLLTLKECLARALADSDKLKAERYRLEVFEERQSQLWWQPFSNFSLEGKFTVVPDKCVDLTGGLVQGCGSSDDIPADDDFRDMTWGPSLHASLKGLVPIPTSGKLWQGKRALENAHSAEEAKLETFEHQISYDVQRAYHAILGAREMMYTLSKGRKHLKTAMKKVEENLANQTGSDTQIDLIKLKVFDAKLDAMEQQIIQIEQSALSGLRFLVGEVKGRPIDVPDIPQEPMGIELMPLDDYKKTAVEHRPEFEALRHAVKALEEKVKFQKSSLAPDLGFGFSFRFGYTPGVKVKKDSSSDSGTPFIFDNDYNYGSIFPGMGLVAKFPLDFGVSIHKIKEAKAELRALTADKKYAMEGILLEVETAYIEATSLGEAIAALKKSKRLARGWLNAAAQNQAVGVGSAGDLKDALKEYFAIMAEYHQKVSEYNIAFAKLDKAVGAPLSLEIVSDSPAK